MFWQGRPQGIGSPHEQNAKHIAVVKAACDDGTVELPKRLGFSIKPSLTGLVVVSKNARISCPKTKGWWNDGIVKADQVKARIEKSFDSDNNILLAAKIISADTLESFANGLAALHTPASFDWCAKFGLPKTVPVQTKPAEAHAPIAKPDPATNAEPVVVDTPPTRIRARASRQQEIETCLRVLRHLSSIQRRQVLLVQQRAFRRKSLLLRLPEERPAAIGLKRLTRTQRFLRTSERQAFPCGSPSSRSSAGRQPGA